MSIRELSSELEFATFAEIVANAYPGFSIETEEQKKKFAEGSIKVQEENPI